MKYGLLCTFQLVLCAYTLNLQILISLHTLFAQIIIITPFQTIMAAVSTVLIIHITVYAILRDSGIYTVVHYL
jgi:hypothetical protein